jgi:hypothetical protein
MPFALNLCCFFSKGNSGWYTPCLKSHSQTKLVYSLFNVPSQIPSTQDYYYNNFTCVSEIKGDCEVPVEQVGLAWDAVCFMFLILQKRLFSGHYFFHMIDEAKAMAILASR